jgi:hypothetical protein
MARREREAELVFRGQQYARAVTLFQRKFAGAYPPNLDTLLNQKFLRKKYKDPITNDDFQLIAVGDAVALQAGASATPGGQAGSAPLGGRGGPPATAQQTQGGGARGAGGGGAGIQGVVSKSTETSLRVFNGRTHYNEWVFIATAASTAAGGGGGGRAGGVGDGPIGGIPRGGGPGRGVPGPEGRPQPPGGRGAPAPGGRQGFPPPGGAQAPGAPGFPQFPGAGRGRF